MNIRIKSVQSKSESLLYVCFESRAGTGIGCWRGDSPPRLDAIYSVEFDIDRTLDNHCAREGIADTFRIQQSGRETKLEGLLESVDSDGMGYFRLAPDCLTMVATSDGWDRPGTWLEITLPAERLEITPLGITEPSVRRPRVVKDGSCELLTAERRCLVSDSAPYPHASVRSLIKALVAPRLHEEVRPIRGCHQVFAFKDAWFGSQSSGPGGFGGGIT